MILKINFKVVSSHSKTLAVSKLFWPDLYNQVLRRQQSDLPDSFRKLSGEGSADWWRRLPPDSPCWRYDRRACPWQWLVWNRCVRWDRGGVAIGNLQIGFKALVANPRRSTKTESGLQNIPVQFGNICFTPNHWIYCDYDGIAVSPINLLAWHTSRIPISSGRTIFQHLNPPWITDKFDGYIYVETSLVQ